MTPKFTRVQVYCTAHSFQSGTRTLIGYPREKKKHYSKWSIKLWLGICCVTESKRSLQAMSCPQLCFPEDKTSSPSSCCPQAKPQDRHIKIKIKGIQSFNQIVFWVASIEYTLYSLVIFAPALVTGIVQTGTILITKSETVGKLKWHIVHLIHITGRDWFFMTVHCVTFWISF